MPNNFTDGENIIEYSTPEELEEKIRYYFPNRIDKVREMATKSHEHYLKYHTAEARLKYMFDIMETE